jgi:hypothetical protein
MKFLTILAALSVIAVVFPSFFFAWAGFTILLLVARALIGDGVRDARGW